MFLYTLSCDECPGDGTACEAESVADALPVVPNPEADPLEALEDLDN